MELNKELRAQNEDFFDKYTICCPNETIESISGYFYRTLAPSESETAMKSASISNFDL